MVNILENFGVNVEWRTIKVQRVFPLFEN